MCTEWTRAIERVFGLEIKLLYFNKPVQLPGDIRVYYSSKIDLRIIASYTFCRSTTLSIGKHCESMRQVLVNA
jgi:hypothetical protein